MIHARHRSVDACGSALAVLDALVAVSRPPVAAFALLAAVAQTRPRFALAKNAQQKWSRGGWGVTGPLEVFVEGVCAERRHIRPLFTRCLAYVRIA